RRRGEGIGYFSLSFVMATAIGPYLAFTLLEYVDYQMLFLLVFTVVLIASVFTIFIKTDNETIDLTKEPKPKFQFVDRDALPAASTILIICLEHSTIFSFVVLYADEQGLCIAAGYFFLVNAVVLLVILPFIGRLMVRKVADIIVY